MDRAPSDTHSAEPEDGAREWLAGSARGWSRVQLAVLGFIGLCGVLQGDGRSRPEWLEGLAGWLGLSALVIACAAIYLVGQVAWPLGGFASSEHGHPARSPESQARRLRLGVALTSAATAVMALAALSNWWPDTTEETEGKAGAGLVRVSAADGRTWCGRLTEAPAGALRIVTDGGQVDVQERSIAEILSVERC